MVSIEAVKEEILRSTYILHVYLKCNKLPGILLRQCTLRTRQITQITLTTVAMMILVPMAAKTPITAILCDSAVREQNQNNNYVYAHHTYMLLSMFGQV